MKFKNIFKIAAATAAIFATVFIFINIFMYAETKNLIKSNDDFGSGYDCIVVLGAGVYNNSTPSLMLKERLDTAAQLYFSGASQKIIVSGDHGTKEYDEVNVMKNYLEEKNIPSENIFMDHAGFSTYETMYRAKEVFCAEKIIVVTQKYHLYRALYIAKSMNLDAFGINSSKTRFKGQLYRDAREAAARFKDFFYVISKPKPTFGGDIIPVSGNGNITNDK